MCSRRLLTRRPRRNDEKRDGGSNQMRELEGIWEDGKMVRRRLKLREATPAGPSIHHTEEQVEGKEIAGAAGGIGGGWGG